MSVVRCADPKALAAKVADSFNDAIAARLGTGQGHVHVALTGGTIATELYRLWPDRPGTAEVDWSRVEVWWGDERWVPSDSDQRNAEPALELLAPMGFGAVHPMPSGEGPGLTAAAQQYSAELGSVRMDICLLGLGPDGHVASVFPGHPSMNASGDPVIAVRNSPKPPPERLSLTLQTISASDEVWFIVSGSSKASALTGSYHGDDELPGAHARGVRRTRWFCDEDAARSLG